MISLLYDAAAVRAALVNSPRERPIDVATYNGVVALLGSAADAMLSDAAARGAGPRVRPLGAAAPALLIGYAQVPTDWRKPPGDLGPTTRLRVDLASALYLLLRRLRTSSVVVAYPPETAPSSSGTLVALVGLVSEAALDPNSLDAVHGVVIDPEVARVYASLQPAIEAVLALVRGDATSIPETAQVQSARATAQWMGRQFQDESRRVEWLSVAAMGLGALAFLGFGALLARRTAAGGQTNFATSSPNFLQSPYTARASYMPPLVTGGGGLGAP